MICNCGAIMRFIGRFDDGKNYHCPSCNNTLIINNRGLNKLYDKDGRPCTYNPPAEPRKEK